MSKKKETLCSRRNFIKVIGAAGATVALNGPAQIAHAYNFIPIRNDLSVTANLSAVTNFSGDLISFAQVTDIHVTDTTNPLRADAIDLIASAALRPQEHLSSRTWDATIRHINHLASDEGIEFLISTGDQIDNAINHEADWFLSVADGKAMPSTYERLVGTTPNRQSPISVPGFTPEGIDMPYYITVGNHDVMIVGTFNARFIRLCFEKLLTTAKEIDPEHWGFSITELEDFTGIFVDSDTAPTGHGFSGMVNSDGYYSFSPQKNICCIVLNTTNDNWLEGLCDDYYKERKHRIDEIAKTHLEKISTSRDFRKVTSDCLKELIDDFETFAKNAYDLQDLDFSFNDGIVGGLCEGTLDRVQHKWLKSEIEANQDKLCLIFSHHGPDSFLSPKGNVKPCELINTLQNYPNVIAHIHGHTHNNLIEPSFNVNRKAENNGGYWDITTSSLAEYPMEWRQIKISIKRDGTGVIKCRMHKPGATFFTDTETKKAYRDYKKARYTAAFDYQSILHLSKMKGENKDRDVDLVFAVPNTAAQYL